MTSGRIWPLALLMLATCGGGDGDEGVACGPNDECPMEFTCEPVSRRCIRSSGADAAPSDACVAGEVTVAVTSPATYACREPFRAMVTLTNGGCTALAIDDIRVTATVTSGSCAPAGPGSYPPAVASVASSATATILDLTGGAFCCAPAACPATFECDERFDFVVSTSGGMVEASVTSRLNLGGCDVICGQ